MTPSTTDLLRALLASDDLPIDDQAWLHNLECAIRRQGDGAVTEEARQRISRLWEQANGTLD